MKNEKENKINKGYIKIYKPKTGDIEFRVRFEKETVWASKKQIAQIFNIDRSVVSRHINNIFKDGEVDKNKVCAKFAYTTKHGFSKEKTQTRFLDYYNLDVILAVGYRTNSNSAIEFRKWSTKVLKNYLIDGYIINQKRLLEVKNNFNKLQETVLFLQAQSKKELLKGQESEILNLLAEFANWRIKIKNPAFSRFFCA